MTSRPFVEYDVVCDRVRGCLIGAKLGDVIGMPWELMSKKDILDATDGKGVTGLQDVPTGYIRKIEDTRGLKLGESTDDWQLTEAVAKSITRCAGFDVIDLALSHVEAYETSTKGWGRSTRTAMEEFKLYFDSRGALGRRPTDSFMRKEKRGLGNGVMMKLSPIPCWMVLSGRVNVDILRLMVGDLIRMTHVETVSYVVAERILDELVGRRGDIVEDVSIDEYDVRKTVDDLFPSSESVPDVEEIYRKCGTSFFATDTARLSLALTHPLRRESRSFSRVVLDAINGGGDTDTNASVCGAIMGARLGREALLADINEHLPEVTSEMWVDADSVAARMIIVAESYLQAVDELLRKLVREIIVQEMKNHRVPNQLMKRGGATSKKQDKEKEAERGKEDEVDEVSVAANVAGFTAPLGLSNDDVGSTRKKKVKATWKLSPSIT